MWTHNIKMYGHSSGMLVWGVCNNISWDSYSKTWSIKHVLWSKQNQIKVFGERYLFSLPRKARKTFLPNETSRQRFEFIISVLFSMQFKILSLWMKCYCVTIQQNFHMVLFVHVVLTFASVNKILWCCHSCENSLEVPLNGTVCFSAF